MKFVAPLAILCSLSAPISAGRYVRGLKGGEDKDGAWYYGRGRAAKLWRYYGYTCADDVVTEYWPHVKQDVYDDCEDMYLPLWPDKVDTCANGAETYVMEKKDECLSGDECENIGMMVAKEIASEFCSTFAYKRSKDETFWPKPCVEDSKDLCKVKVFDLIEEDDWGSCEDVKDSYRDIPYRKRRQMKWECEDKIDWINENTVLP